MYNIHKDKMTAGSMDIVLLVQNVHTFKLNANYSRLNEDFKELICLKTGFNCFIIFSSLKNEYLFNVIITKQFL